MDGPDNKYQLHISGGDTPARTFDFMAFHNNMYFSTKDRDNDASPGGHCAELRKGGWWYGNCYFTNPNGLHDSPAITDRIVTISANGLRWIYYPNYEIKIRPKSGPL